MNWLSVSISLFSMVYCFFFLLDPFEDRQENRNSKKLLDNRKFLWKNITVSILLPALGSIGLLYNDKGAFAFSFMPISFIGFYLLADHAVKKFSTKKFILIVRGDSLKNRSIFDILLIFLVIALPALTPILILLF